MDVAGECLLYHDFMISLDQVYMADSPVPTINPGEEND
jgi:hypothetical protein